MNAAAFFSELIAVILSGALFCGAGFAVWLLCDPQSAARVSWCGRLIVIVTLGMMFSGFGMAWQRSRIPADVITAAPAVTMGVPLPEAEPAGESPSVLNPLPDDNTTIIDVPVQAAPGDAADAARPWQMSPVMTNSLVTIWVVGAAVIALRWFIALFLRRRFVRRAEEVTDHEWLHLLTAHSVGMKPPLLLRYNGSTIPCAWGIFQPVILLPKNANAWPESQRRMVLAHECAHLRRRDPLWQAAGEIFLALQWFNPFAWLILRHCRMADERAADDAVLRGEPDAPAYAELLVACARKWSASRCTATVTSGMASPSTVCRRVERVLDPAADRRPAGVFWPTVWLALSALLAAVVIFLTPRIAVAQELSEQAGTASVSQPWPADKEPQTLEELHAALDTLKIPAMKFDAVPLQAALRGLHTATYRNFIVRATDEKKVTLELHETTLRGAIEAICKASEMEFDFYYTTAMVSVRPVSDGLRMRSRAYQVPESFPGTLPTEVSRLTAMLQSAGIQFPEGAVAQFYAAKRYVVVKHTAEGHRHIYGFIHSGKGDAPFPWHPVTIDGRPYVSSWEVRIFGEFNFPDDDGLGEIRDGKVTFVNKRLAMTWRKDDTAVSINNQRLNLSHPIAEQQKMLYMPLDDFMSLVEPKVRPANVQARPADPPPSAKPPPAPAPEEKQEPHPTDSEKTHPDHSWNPVKLGELEYIAAGEVARFYSFPQQKTDSDGNFWLRSAALVVRWRKDSNEILINNVRFLLKHPVMEHENGLWISRPDLARLLHPILKPAHIKSPPQVNTVVIDAGHGGLDAGAVGRHGKESDFTLDTAQRLKRKLEALGFRVMMTRSDDSYLTRAERVAIANAEENAILISVHFDSFTEDRSGIRTFFPDEAMADSGASEDERHAWHSASVALATAVHANALYKLRSTDGGVKSNEVLQGIRLPMAMIEGGYLSNAEEGARIASPEYRERLADGIAGGVQNFVRALRANRQRNRSAPVPPPPEIKPPE
jgi:N-acetylmuramoyl-L-alanine amidase